MASFGEKLRRERELRGVPLQEIAQATKITARFLQAIEQDRLDVLPGGLFPRAFVRQYAKHLGLDADRLVTEFIASQRADGAEPPAAFSRRRPGNLKLLGIGALLMAAGLAYSHQKTRRDERTARVPTPTPVTLPTDRVYPPPSDQAEESAGSLVLTLRARRTSWVAVSADGSQVLNRTLREGETEVLEAQGEIVLSVGNAGGVVFTVNDRPGVPLGREGEVRKNIVITRQSLSSLVEEAPPVRTSHSS
jgi:cytoskeleton protein RodZ